MPVLETERLVLRPMSAADAEALYRISNEPAVRHYLWDDRPVSRVTIERVVAQSVRLFSEERLGLFGIRLRDREEVVGFCGFARLQDMEEVELVYELDPELWGRGIATEAARACLGYAFKEVGLERMIAGTDRPNVASLRVIEKLGMKIIGNINPRAPEDPYFAIDRQNFLAAGEEGS